MERITAQFKKILTDPAVCQSSADEALEGMTLEEIADLMKVIFSTTSLHEATVAGAMFVIGRRFQSEIMTRDLAKLVG